MEIDNRSNNDLGDNTSRVNEDIIEDEGEMVED